jgi:hypothetical protein
MYGKDLLRTCNALVREPLCIRKCRLPICLGRVLTVAAWLRDPDIHLLVGEALHGEAALHAARIPGDKVESVADLSGYDGAPVVCKDVDPGRTWATEVQQEWADAVLLVSGGEDRKRDLSGRAARICVVERNLDGCATNLWVIANDRIIGAALPLNGSGDGAAW